MIALCYTRTENETKAGRMQKQMASWCGNAGHDFAGFFWDAMSGQRGLVTTLRLLGRHEGKERLIVVDSLSDLGRDLPGLVKQIHALLGIGVSVYSIATGLMFSSDKPESNEAKVVEALSSAHFRYTSDNRKRAIASAREAGATIGRPTVFTLDGVREVISNLTDKNDGDIPSVRKVAEKIGCGHTKAAQLIREYKAEKKKEGTPE